MNQEALNSEEPDAATLAFLNCVFPNGLLETEYWALLHVLRKDMSIRAASSLVGILMGKPYIDIYNDALGANHIQYDQQIIDDLTSRLEACNYRTWLDA